MQDMYIKPALVKDLSETSLGLDYFGKVFLVGALGANGKMHTSNWCWQMNERVAAGNHTVRGDDILTQTYCSCSKDYGIMARGVNQREHTTLLLAHDLLVTRRRIEKRIAKKDVPPSYRNTQTTVVNRLAKRVAQQPTKNISRILRAEVTNQHEMLVETLNRLCDTKGDAQARAELLNTLGLAVPEAHKKTFGNTWIVVASSDTHKLTEHVKEALAEGAVVGRAGKVAAVLPVWAWHGVLAMGGAKDLENLHLVPVTLPETVNSNDIELVVRFVQAGLIAWSNDTATLEQVCENPGHWGETAAEVEIAANRDENKLFASALGAL